MSQTYVAPFTPLQRWILLQLALDNNAAPLTTAAEGKAFRRALRAFGLQPIREAMGGGTKVSTAQASSQAPALFQITAENVETALKWATTPRHPSMEMDAGEAFDLLEQLRDNPTAWTTPEGIPAYDPKSEDWRATADICQKCGGNLRDEGNYCSGCGATL